MKTFVRAAVFSISIIILITNQALAQTANQSTLFRLSEGFVRIAEPGQIADTLSVWGDVNAPGRYIIPRGTMVHELISYARGPLSSRTAGTLDWSKVKLQISISRYNENTEQETVETYTHRYQDPYPAELRNFQLRSDDVVGLEVKQSPAFVDYLRVFSTVVSATATTIIVIDRLTE